MKTLPLATDTAPLLPNGSWTASPRYHLGLQRLPDHPHRRPLDPHPVHPPRRLRAGALSSWCFAVVVMWFRLRNPWLPGKNRRVYVDE